METEGGVKIGQAYWLVDSGQRVVQVIVVSLLEELVSIRYPNGAIGTCFPDELEN